MADYGKFQLGGVVYPVEASPFVKALPKLDPPIYKALAFYKAMLVQHLGIYSDALSGGNNRATALSLNACPYLATSFFRYRPRVSASIEATTILTQRERSKVAESKHGSSRYDRDDHSHPIHSSRSYCAPPSFFGCREEAQTAHLDGPFTPPFAAREKRICTMPLTFPFAG